MKITCLSVAAPVILWAGLAVGQSFPLGPGGRDTYIDNRTAGPGGDLTDDNFGSAALLKVGHTDPGSENQTVGLVRFDLAGTPAAGVSRAYLSLAIAPETTSVGAPVMVTAHQVTSPWDEGTVTWDLQPASDAAVVGSALVANVPRARFRWDITPLYQGWKSGAVPNHGVRLVAWDNSGREFEFVSAENTAHPDLQPVLIVETDAGAGTALNGQFVLHELTDAFSGTDYAGRPGTFTHLLMESSALAFSAGLVDESIVGNYHVRGLGEMDVWLPDHGVRNSILNTVDGGSEVLSGTFTTAADGDVWVYEDEETLRYHSSADGNCLLHFGNERDGEWRSLGVGFGVRKGSGMNAASVSGDWVVVEVGRTFGLPYNWPPPDPDYAWLSMEGVLCSRFVLNYDGVSGFTADGPEVVMERTVGDHQVMRGVEPNIDNQFWTEFLFDVRDDGGPWSGTYTMDPDGRLVQTVDDDGDLETIPWNVSADGDVMVSGEYFNDGIWSEALLGVGVRKPLVMTPGELVGSWSIVGLESSFHAPPGMDRNNRETLGYRSWFTLRADGTYLERIEDYRMNQAFFNDVVGDGGSPEESVVRNHVELEVSGPEVEFVDGTWSVTADGTLTFIFEEDGEQESMQLQVAANGQVMVGSDTWNEAGYSGCEFLVGVRMPTAPPAAIGAIQRVGTGDAPSVQLPIEGSHPNLPVRVQSLTPGGDWEDKEIGGSGGAILIDPAEIGSNPVQLFRVE